MTSFTFVIELRRLHTLVLMRVMTAQTSHFAVQKAFAGSEHAVLIAMHVDRRCRFPRGLLEKVKKPVTRLKAEGGFGLCQCASMTEPAQIETLFPRALRGVEYRIPTLGPGILLMKGNMFRSGAVAFLALHA